MKSKITNYKGKQEPATTGNRKMRTATLIICLVTYLTLCIALVNCVQNDFADAEEGLVTLLSGIKPNDSPENTQEIIMKATNNELSAEMLTNKTRALVTCESGEILVKINFTEPFRGVAYADNDSLSPCSFNGEGATYYEMRLPLKGCGTKEEAPRLFINHIVLRFHKSLVLEEDEEKTIVCRYPPPQAPEPPSFVPPAPIKEIPLEPAQLTQYEPFIIIAGLLFMTLALVGLGTTSYLIRKQTLIPITQKETVDTFHTTITDIEKQMLDSDRIIIPFPKLETQTIEDVFFTKIDQTERLEEITHNNRLISRPQIEQQEFDDIYITNQHEIEEEERLYRLRLANMSQLESQDCDDTYITNQDETIEEENLMTQSVMTRPKIEIRTIEDTFITEVNEVTQDENTTHHKSREDHYEERTENYEKYR